MPIYYKKVSDTLGPILRNGYQTVREYSTLALVKIEPYRQQVVVYINQAVDYVFSFILKTILKSFSYNNYIDFKGERQLSIRCQEFGQCHGVDCQLFDHSD